MDNHEISGPVLSTKIEYISKKIDNMDGHLIHMNETINNLAVLGIKQNAILEQQEKILEQNTESLKEHIRRTDLLEKDSAGFKSLINFIKWGIGILIPSIVALLIKLFFGG